MPTEITPGVRRWITLQHEAEFNLRCALDNLGSELLDYADKPDALDILKAIDYLKFVDAQRTPTHHVPYQCVEFWWPRFQASVDQREAEVWRSIRG